MHSPDVFRACLYRRSKMGLDMYLYRVTKLDDEEKEQVDNMTVDELNDSEFAVYTLKQGDEEEKDSLLHDASIAELIPYMYQIKRKQKYINLIRLKREKGIPEDARQSGEVFGEGEYWLWFRMDDKKWEVELTGLDEATKERITDVSEDILGVFLKDEVAYWRKNYGLQQKMHDSCDVKVENCGYYKLNDFMKKSVRDEKDGYEDLDMEETDDSAVFYYEWY